MAFLFMGYHYETEVHSHNSHKNMTSGCDGKGFSELALEIAGCRQLLSKKTERSVCKWEKWMFALKLRSVLTSYLVLRLRNMSNLPRPTETCTNRQPSYSSTKLSTIIIKN